MNIITDIKYIQKLITQDIPELSFLADEPMKMHTSFKIGGNADVLAFPSSEEEVIKVVSLAKQNNIPLTIIGNGSNLLVSDRGIEGIVVALGKKFSSVSVSEERITATAGTLLSRVSNVALNANLTGMEFASGIPGSLGGAIVMNAGAYGGEMKDVVVTTRYLNSEGVVCECNGEEHSFSYRKSCFGPDDIILSSVLELKYGDPKEIKDVMNQLNEKRREKQPLEYPSAGSTFKRPEGYFAAKLIDDAGLRGYRIGDAMVSEKHCGFVVNAGDATCGQVIELMDYITHTVNEKFGVALEPEVRLLGRK